MEVQPKAKPLIISRSIAFYCSFGGGEDEGFLYHFQKDYIIKDGISHCTHKLVKAKIEESILQLGLDPFFSSSYAYDEKHVSWIKSNIQQIGSFRRMLEDLLWVSSTSYAYDEKHVWWIEVMSNKYKALEDADFDKMEIIVAEIGWASHGNLDEKSQLQKTQALIISVLEEIISLEEKDSNDAENYS